MLPDRLLRIILGWTAVTLIFVWLPLVRCVMDGSSYAWGAGYWGWSVGGSGLGGDYWLLVVQAAFGLSILWLGWRGGHPPFGRLLAIWHGVSASSAVYASLTHPEEYRFRGDTMGIDVSIAWVGPLLYGGFFLLCLYWIVKNRQRDRVSPEPLWTTRNTVWLGGLVSLLPVQFVLLRFGEVHGLTDQIGVVLTIAQCLCLGRAFRVRVPANPAA